MTKAKNIPAPNCKTRNRFSGKSISLNRNKSSHIYINAEATLSTAFGFSSSHTHTYCNWPRRSRCDNPCARRICGVHRCNFRLRCKWTRYFDTLQTTTKWKRKRGQNKNEKHVHYRNNGYTNIRRLKLIWTKWNWTNSIRPGLFLWVTWHLKK